MDAGVGTQVGTRSHQVCEWVFIYLFIFVSSPCFPSKY